MKHKKWQIRIGIGLIISSLLIYTVHYLVFKDLHHILVFGLEDIAFIPIEVLLVTLVIEGFLQRREKARLLEKLNMLIGLFYTRMGLKVLIDFVENDDHKELIQKDMMISPDWTDRDFTKLMDKLKQYEYKISFTPKSLACLKAYLHDNRDFLTGMLQNQNLLEHETFTELLSAIFHLQDELEYRVDVEKLKDYELMHMGIDLERVYRLLTIEWVAYMKYIKEEYPYMFVTALIHNPYDPRSANEIEKELLKDNYNN